MKRFTDTAKWDKEWFCNLPPKLKCFWDFICIKCDAAGVWEPNFALASFLIREPIGVEDLHQMSDRGKSELPRMIRLSTGKYFIGGFIEFQHGKLSRECKAHIPVFRLLVKHFGTKPDQDIFIGYGYPIEWVQEKEKDPVREMVVTPKGEGAEGGNNPGADVPSVAEIVAFGNTSAGIPESFCQYYHEQKEIKRTWFNGYGTLINWRKEVVTWWSQNRHKWASSTSPPSKKESIWEKKQRVDFITEEITQIRTRGGSDGQGNYTVLDKDRERYATLLAERKRLKAEIKGI